MEWLLLVLRGAVLLGFDAGAEFPEEGGEFPGDADFDFVMMKLSFFEHFEAVVETSLGFPGEVFDPAVCSFLSFGKLGADFGWDAVVGGLLDEDPASVGIPAFGNASTALFVSAGVFGGDESEEGHEFFGMFEAAEGSDFADGDHGGDELESFEGHHGLNEGFALPVLEKLKHGFFEFDDAFVMEVDGCDVVFKDAIVGSIGEGEVAEVAQVGLGPVGLAVVVEAETSEQGEEACFGPAKVVDGIGAGAAEVANGFVHGVRDIDGDEVVGAEIFGELHGVAFIGFDSVARFDGDERRGDDFATDAHLQESSGDPEAATAGFVADVKIGEWAVLFFGDAADGSLEGVLGGGDGSVVAGFCVAVTFEDGDDGLFFMNVESEVECLRCV